MLVLDKWLHDGIGWIFHWFNRPYYGYYDLDLNFIS